MKRAYTIKIRRVICEFHPTDKKQINYWMNYTDPSGYSWLDNIQAEHDRIEADAYEQRENGMYWASEYNNDRISLYLNIGTFGLSRKAGYLISFMFTPTQAK